jgi:hypothetical protein
MDCHSGFPSDLMAGLCLDTDLVGFSGRWSSKDLCELSNGRRAPTKHLFSDSDLIGFDERRRRNEGAGFGHPRRCVGHVRL